MVWGWLELHVGIEYVVWECNLEIEWYCVGEVNGNWNSEGLVGGESWGDWFKVVWDGFEVVDDRG